MRGCERNVYVFLAAMLVVIVLTSLYLVQYNRRMFDQVAVLSERRSELAQQLISMQENTFRSISRELHDDFGQILTAIGAMLAARGLARIAGPSAGRSARGPRDRANYTRQGAVAIACSSSSGPRRGWPRKRAGRLSADLREADRN